MYNRQDLNFRGLWGMVAIHILLFFQILWKLFQDSTSASFLLILCYSFFSYLTSLSYLKAQLKKLNVEEQRCCNKLVIYNKLQNLIYISHFVRPPHCSTWLKGRINKWKRAKIYGVATSSNKSLMGWQHYSQHNFSACVLKSSKKICLEIYPISVQFTVVVVQHYLQIWSKRVNC